ncbi:hypothetical protein [Celerinatantimonas sp. YJH-8]|uniref:hypothetical protein n=1 Tax=Celerinatantimonas sp. YJH-8 TaxID=3228714 RepID=UPI0038C6F31F
MIKALLTVSIFDAKKIVRLDGVTSQDELEHVESPFFAKAVIREALQTERIESVSGLRELLVERSGTTAKQELIRWLEEKIDNYSIAVVTSNPMNPATHFLSASSDRPPQFGAFRGTARSSDSLPPSPAMPEKPSEKKPRTPPQETPLLTWVEYRDFLNRPAEQSIQCYLGTSAQSAEECGPFDYSRGTLYQAQSQISSGMKAYAHHSEDLSQQYQHNLDILKTATQALLTTMRKDAAALQGQYDDAPWFKKPLVGAEIRADGMLKGLGGFVASVWDLTKQVATLGDYPRRLLLHPIDENLEIARSVENGLSQGIEVLKWLWHDKQAWPVLTDFAAQVKDIFDHYPLYSDHQGAYFIGGMLPGIILAILTEQPEVLGDELAPLVDQVSMAAKKIAYLDAEFSREASEVKVVEGGTAKLLSKKPKPVVELAPPFKVLPKITTAMGESDIEQVLADAAENIKNYGSSAVLLDDEQLTALVNQGLSAKEGEWMVRLVTDFYKPSTADAFAAENGLGRILPEKPMTCWTTKFEYVKNDDSRADLLRRSLGISDGYFHPDGNHYLFIFRQPKLPKTRFLFSPTNENMTKFILDNPLDKFQDYEISEAMIRKAFSKEYIKEYRQGRANLPEIAWDKAKFLKVYAKNLYPDSIFDQSTFIARFLVEKEYGVFDVWEGNGLTRYIGYKSEISATDSVIHRQYGAPEIFMVDKNPKTIEKMVDGADNLIKKKVH